MENELHFSNYANDIGLFDDFSIEMNRSENKEQLVEALLVELKEYRSSAKSYADKRRLIHAKLNTLAPKTLKTDAVEKLNRLLQSEMQEKELTSIAELMDRSTKLVENTKLVVWKGDITTLKIDAIVNAANSQLLGCFSPMHKCIDNAIHSAAGVQLRDDCDTIMQRQGFLEPTGVAKITRAYNLPSNYVIHTVGPIVQNQVTEKNRADLANAYISCLDICKEIDAIRSIAFCGISTGVFGYPAEKAANVVVYTVKEWLKINRGCLDVVVFNVFSDNDKMIYKALGETL